MTITQLLTDIALLAGILLFAVLAVVPLWLEHEAEQVDRPVSTDRHAAARPSFTRPSRTRLPKPQPQSGVVGQAGQPGFVH